MQTKQNMGGSISWLRPNMDQLPGSRPEPNQAGPAAYPHQLSLMSKALGDEQITDGVHSRS